MFFQTSVFMFIKFKNRRQKFPNPSKLNYLLFNQTTVLSIILKLVRQSFFYVNFVRFLHVGNPTSVIILHR
jgi:hypothetical protein